VGIDHTFYRPPAAELLAHYASQVPEDFRFCQKVWEEITIPRYATHPRYGAKAGRVNPRFLDAQAFVELVLPPSRIGLGDRAGAFIFEFQRHGIPPADFLSRLDAFLDRLPPGPQYAVEIRTAGLLGPRYADCLRAHRAAHVYNHWSLMPPLAAQHRRLGETFSADFVVFRLLTPLGLSHSEAVERYRPYDRLCNPLPEMREDTTALLRQACQDGKSAYVLVNNRAEGNAPATVQALADALTIPPASSAS
jgi:uncharacterized protein YecE (DUF72 family)